MASPLVWPRPKSRARASLPPRNTDVSSVNTTRAPAIPGGAFGCLCSTMFFRALAVEMISARGQEPDIAAAVVGMMVSAEHVLHGLVGHGLDLRHDAFEILLVLVIHQNHALARDVHRDVAAVALDLKSRATAATSRCTSRARA